MGSIPTRPTPYTTAGRTWREPLAADAGSAKHLAREVVGNIDAMRAAVDDGTDADPFTPERIADLHRLLMARSIGITKSEYRTEQNWIGAERIEDGGAYVPPPPGLVPELLDDLDGASPR